MAKSKNVASRKRRNEKLRKAHLITALEEWELEGRDMWRIPRLRKPLAGCARIYAAHRIREDDYKHTHCEPFPDPELYPHLLHELAIDDYKRPAFSEVNPKVEGVKELMRVAMRNDPSLPGAIKFGKPPPVVVPKKNST